MVSYPVIKRYEKDGKLVGNLLMVGSTKTYYTVRDATKDHYYKIGQGYPISDDILQDLKKNECEIIWIRETQKDGLRRDHKIPITDYLKSEAFEHPPYDIQRCTPLINGGN